MRLVLLILISITTGCSALKETGDTNGFESKLSSVDFVIYSYLGEMVKIEQQSEVELIFKTFDFDLPYSEEDYRQAEGSMERCVQRFIFVKGNKIIGQIVCYGDGIEVFIDGEGRGRFKFHEVFIGRKMRPLRKYNSLLSGFHTQYFVGETQPKKGFEFRKEEYNSLK